MSKRPILTIGMPTCYDFSGALQSIMALKIYHDLDNGDLEIIVVDNTPEDSYREKLREQIYTKAIPERASDYKIAENVKYFEFTEQKGPAETKNMVFENATGEYVMCIDSHVLLAKNQVQELIAFLKSLKGEDRDHFYTGPLRHNNGQVSTHWDIKWRGQMLGTWGQNMDLMKDNTPKDIPANGCGLFLCRKDSWLGFNKNFNGFGGEEVYIHAKYMKEGRRVLMLPNLVWWHRFGNPDARHYSLNRYSKIRNYVLGFLELDLNIKDIYNHFVNLDVKDTEELRRHLVEEHSVDQRVVKDLSDKKLRVEHARHKITENQWKWLISDPINNTKAIAEPKEDEYQKIMQTVDDSDLSSHMPIFRQFAEECNTYCEISRRAHSCLPAAAAGLKVKSFLYNTGPLPAATSFEDVHFEYVERFETGLDLVKNSDDTYDMFFLKLAHEAHAVRTTLDIISKKANKFIAIHDTLFNLKDNMGSALSSFVEETEWSVAYHNNSQYGFTVLYKGELEEKIVAWVPEVGPGTEMKKLLKRVGIEATPDCSCNARANDMNVRGEEWCLDNLEIIADWLEYEAKKREGVAVKLFTRTAAKLLVRTACKLSSRKKKKLGIL